MRVFFKHFGQTHTLVPLFWTFGDVSPGFQSKSALCLIHFFAEAIVHSQRSTSGATCADLLAAGSAAKNFPTCISRGGSWLAITAQKMKALPLYTATSVDVNKFVLTSEQTSLFQPFECRSDGLEIK